MDISIFEQHIVLENSRVRLVPFERSFTEGLKEIMFDEEITRYTGNHFRTEADLQAYVDRTLRSREERRAYPFIVLDSRSGKVAGSTRYGNIEIGNKRLEIGWTWYGKPYRGTGLNHACKYELLRFAFEHMDIRRVQFSVDAENRRSQKAVLKLGAVREGLFRSNYVAADGTSRDDVYFSMLQSEWADIKKTRFQECEGAVYEKARGRKESDGASGH